MQDNDKGLQISNKTETQMKSDKSRTLNARV